MVAVAQKSAVHRIDETGARASSVPENIAWNAITPSCALVPMSGMPSRTRAAASDDVVCVASPHSSRR